MFILCICIFFFYFHSQLFIFSLKKEGRTTNQTKNTIEAEELSQEEKIEKHLHTEQKERRIWC